MNLFAIICECLYVTGIYSRNFETIPSEAIATVLSRLRLSGSISKNKLYFMVYKCIRDYYKIPLDIIIYHRYKKYFDEDK